MLAGGQSLIPLMSLRLARPTALIDLNGVAELSSIAVNGIDRHRRDDPSPSGRAFGRRREAGSPARGRRSLHRPRRDPHSRHDRRQPGSRRSRRRAPRDRARPRRDLRGDEHPWHPHDQRGRLLRRVLHDHPRARRDADEGHVPERRSGHRCVGAGDGPAPRRLRDGRCRGVGRRRAATCASRSINVVRPAGQSGRGRGRDETRSADRRSCRACRARPRPDRRPPRERRVPPLGRAGPGPASTDRSRSTSEGAPHDRHSFDHFRR